MVAQDQWTWWREALAGTIGLLNESNPQSGFYRHFKGLPVAIWREGETVICLMDGTVSLTDPVDIGKVWLESAKRPITKEIYDQRVAAGHWPTGRAAVAVAEPAATEPAAASTTAAAGEPTAAEEAPRVESAPVEVGPGHNVAGDLTGFAAMRAEILEQVSEVAAWQRKTKIESKPQADRAHDWSVELTALARKADKAREAEKAPIWAELKAIEERWQGIIKPATASAAALEQSAQAWGRAEAARLHAIAEAKRKEEWERAQAAARKSAEEEAAKRAAEAAARRATAPEHDPETGEVVEPEPATPDPVPEMVLDLPLPAAPPPKVMLGSGASGNRRAVKEPPATATVLDLMAAAQHFAKVEQPELVALIQKLADKAAKSRALIPGVRFSWQNKTEAE